ncbi:MAG: hypothetical protein JEZ14_17105 [Marinilabiliaceae bacterium]|nr:hypothetical protein [Marinilabiliaceae bacterium]
MKKIFTILIAVLFTATLWAQSPEKMSYQAVVRDASSALVTNQTVGMQISILQGSETGTAVYVETKTTTTNANGLVSLEIGTGTVESGDFTTIDWANDSYFIKTETDPAGGSNYTITGTSQLLSVPYALYAKTAETFTGAITETDPLYVAWDKDYGDLTNKPSNVSSFTNDAGYLTSEIDGSTTNEIELPTQTGNSGKMLTTDGSSPSWAAVSFNDLSDKPANLDLDSTDDFDGNYNNLTNKPSNVSSFTNDAGYLTSIAANSVDGTNIALGSDTQGDIMYYNGTDWVRLAAGTSGQVLQTNGAGANPSWEDAAGGGSSMITQITYHTSYDHQATGEYLYMSGGGSGNNPSIDHNRVYLVAPFDGELVKVMIASSSVAAGSTLVALRKNNSTTNIESQIVNMASADVSYTFTFSSATFSAGDRLHIYIQPNVEVNLDDLIVTCVWEYTL